jgi:hypothetical protein
MVRLGYCMNRLFENVFLQRKCVPLGFENNNDCKIAEKLDWLHVFKMSDYSFAIEITVFNYSTIR